MNRFSQALASAQSQINQAFGETVIVEPWKTSEYFDGSPDSNVDTYQITGVVDLDGQSMGVTGTRYKAKIDSNLKGYNAVVSVLVSDLTGPPAKPRPSKGWRLRLPERATETILVVGDVRPDGQSRLHIYVEVLKR